MNNSLGSVHYNINSRGIYKMKKTKKNLVRLLAIGLLLMNGIAVINLIFKTNINIDIIDFMRGMGLPIIIWSAYHIAKMPIKRKD